MKIIEDSPNRLALSENSLWIILCALVPIACGLLFYYLPSSAQHPNILIKTIGIFAIILGPVIIFCFRIGRKTIFDKAKNQWIIIDTFVWGRKKIIKDLLSIEKVQLVAFYLAPGARNTSLFDADGKAIFVGTSVSLKYGPTIISGLRLFIHNTNETYHLTDESGTPSGSFGSNFSTLLATRKIGQRIAEFLNIPFIEKVNENMTLDEIIAKAEEFNKNAI